jgi:hypothetical protein
MKKRERKMKKWIVKYTATILTKVTGKINDE